MLKKKFIGHILIAEDNEVNQLVINDLITEFGLTADIAHNGLEAVQLCQKSHYDLILMDIQMPIMDGFEATKRIRQFNPHIPIVALSAAVMHSDKLLSQEAGMSRHLAKPIEEDALESVLTDYLTKKEATILTSQINTNQQTEQNITGQCLDIEGIDFPKLKRLFNTREKIEKLLNTFANTQRNFCHQLNAQKYGESNFNQLIHSLKGVAGNAGVARVYQWCTDIEHTKDDTAIRPMIENLCTELTRVIYAIDHRCQKQELDKQQGDEQQHQDNTRKLTGLALQTLVDTILTKLTKNELIPDEEREMLTHSIIRSNFSEDKIKQLDEAFEAFDFATAISLVLTLKNQLNIA